MPFRVINIQEGYIVVDEEKKVKASDKDAVKQLADYFFEKNIEEVTCSSSVDHADEYGVPEGIDVGSMIGEALAIAVRRKHSVSIRWGSEDNDKHTERFEFNSDEELKAFLKGVDAAAGWGGVEYELE